MEPSSRMPSAFRVIIVLLPAANSMRPLLPRVSLRATRLTMSEATSPSERLTSLEKTLSGLREEGYDKEMLEPLLREIELLKMTAAAAPDKPPSPPTAPPAAPPAAAPPSTSQNPDSAASSTPPPPLPPTSTSQPTPTFVRPFNPDSAASTSPPPPPPSPPPSPPTPWLGSMQQLRSQSERDYVAPTGLSPAAELLRRRREARLERGEQSGGGGGGGWFGGLGLSPEAKAAREQAQAAAVSHVPRTPTHPRLLSTRAAQLGSARARRRRPRRSRRRSWLSRLSDSCRTPRCAQGGRSQVGLRAAVPWRCHHGPRKGLGAGAGLQCGRWRTRPPSTQTAPPSRGRQFQPLFLDLIALGGVVALVPIFC